MNNTDPFYIKPEKNNNNLLKILSIFAISLIIIYSVIFVYTNSSLSTIQKTVKTSTTPAPKPITTLNTSAVNKTICKNETILVNKTFYYYNPNITRAKIAMPDNYTLFNITANKSRLYTEMNFSFINNFNITVGIMLNAGLSNYTSAYQHSNTTTIKDFSILYFGKILKSDNFISPNKLIENISAVQNKNFSIIIYNPNPKYPVVVSVSHLSFNYEQNETKEICS
jgi:hypothetical protein